MIKRCEKGAEKNEKKFKSFKLCIIAGLFFFRESWVSFRLKGSYQWTFAKEIHHGFGVSIGILFANSRPGLKAIDVSK